LTLYRFAYFFPRSFLAEAVGDVGHVTKCAGEVSFENVGIKVADFSAANGIDEVILVLTGAGSGELLYSVSVVGV
jgi:hypothetical protein